jgi:hypothetical protein
MLREPKMVIPPERHHWLRAYDARRRATPPRVVSFFDHLVGVGRRGPRLQQLRQLGDVNGDPPRLVARHGKELSRCEQAESTINEFKQLLRRFIAVCLNGFYP